MGFAILFLQNPAAKITLRRVIGYTQNVVKPFVGNIFKVLFIDFLTG